MKIQGFPFQYKFQGSSGQESTGTVRPKSKDKILCLCIFHHRRSSLLSFCKAFFNLEILLWLTYWTTLKAADFFSKFIFLKYHLFIYWGALGLHCCAQVFCSPQQAGLLCTGVHRLLTARWLLLLRSYTLVTWALVVVPRRFSCPEVWNLPGPRIGTWVPCFGRRILNHCTIREVQGFQIREAPREEKDCRAGLRYRASSPTTWVLRLTRIYDSGGISSGKRCHVISLVGAEP